MRNIFLTVMAIMVSGASYAAPAKCGKILDIQTQEEGTSVTISMSVPGETVGYVLNAEKSSDIALAVAAASNKLKICFHDVTENGSYVSPTSFSVMSVDFVQ